MVNTKLFAAVVVISSLGVLAAQVLAPIEARYLSSLTVDPRLVGFVFAFASVVFAILSFYLGRLSDMYGRRWFILGGLFIGIYYPLLYSVITTVFDAYGVKLTWAFAAVAMGPLMSAYVQDLIGESPKKGQLFGYLYSAQSIAGSFGALIGGFTAEQFGFAMPFYIIAGMYVLALLIALFMLPKKEHHVSEENTKRKRSIRETFAFIVSKPQLLFYLALNTSWGINWGIKAFLWPLVIFALAGSDLVTGSIFATMGIIAFILLPFVGKLIDKHGPYKASIVQFTLLGLMGTFMCLTDNLMLFWVLAGIYTIGEVLNTAQSVIIAEQVPSNIRGEVLGLDAIMDRTLNTIAPFFAGFLLLSLEPRFVLLIFFSLFWVSLIIAYGIYFTKIRPLKS